MTWFIVFVKNMELAAAILVFMIENFLKLFVLIAPICALWKYYNSIGHVYIIILELILTLALIVIMFASLLLVKMDCRRIANYFMLPLALGISYINVAHYYRASVSRGVGGGETSNELSDGTSSVSYVDDGFKSSSTASYIVLTIELYFSNGLALMSIVQMVANLFAHRLAKIIH